MKIALLGNPNSGKSTLFNALTGSTQAVGNWPGVTVERKSGYFSTGTAHSSRRGSLKDWIPAFAGMTACGRGAGMTACGKGARVTGCEEGAGVTAYGEGEGLLSTNNTEIEIVDLPGIYSLTQTGENRGLDAKIAVEAILSGEFDGVVNIVDVCNLERNLYLTAQLADMHIPVVVALNMMDIAKKRGISVNVEALSQSLGCKIIPVTATQKNTVQNLKSAIANLHCSAPIQQFVTYPEAICAAIQTLAKNIPAKNSHFQAIQLLETETPHNALATEQKKAIEQNCQEEADILIADARYTAIHAIKNAVVQKNSVSKNSFTQRIDKIVLNRFLGIPIFLAMMYCMFFFAMNVGGAFQPFFDIGSEAIFIQGFGSALQFLHVPAQWATLLAAGIGSGINTVATFIPVIGALFLFLAALESSGYMARAAFVVDRGMRALGLPGKSFVPLIVGFGCNVPAILAARTLENRSDRLLTTMMAPFMSCGARMAIYAVFSTVFFPHSGQNVVFALYVIGILVAVMTGFVLRKTVLQGNASPLIMELPTYHKPVFTVLLRQTWQRLRHFLWGAGKYIVPVCIIVTVLNMISVEGHFEASSANKNSILSTIGKTVTPVFSPLGLQEENWPATVGLLTGVLAKEVVVGTLNTLYSQQAQLPVAADAQLSVSQKIKSAFNSIPEQLTALKDSFKNPIAATAANANMDTGVMGVMFHHFDGAIGAMAYLLFVLLYVPCISTVAVLMQESGLRWGIFSVCWSTGLAYAVSVIFYQAATWARHPSISALWIAGLLILFVAVLKIMQITPPGSSHTSAIKGAPPCS